MAGIMQKPSRPRHCLRGRLPNHCRHSSDGSLPGTSAEEKEGRFTKFNVELHRFEMVLSTWSSPWHVTGAFEHFESRRAFERLIADSVTNGRTWPHHAFLRRHDLGIFKVMTRTSN
jgi:hypothetical protein